MAAFAGLDEKACLTEVVLKQRLQKLLSGAGVCSRRAAEKEIAAGNLQINGRTASLGDSADPETDTVLWKGQKITFRRQPKKYLMLYKPVGVVTTMHDEKGRKSVADLVECGRRVYPVGRLDYASEGLLLMTDDGDLANRLMHPRHHVDKTYRVEVKGDPDRVPELEKPMKIDGYEIQPAAVKLLRMLAPGKMVLRITIHEGRNRQIRKMCQQCGFRVNRLQRIAIRELKLDPKLRPGQWRELTKKEQETLFSYMA